jgi:hypothetical protein
MPISDALSFWHGGALLLANTRARSATAPRRQRHHNPPVQLPGVAWARGEAMTYPLTTTLNRIKACNPCHSGWVQGLAAAGKSSPDDEPVLFSAIAKTVGISNAIWCMRAEPQYSYKWRLFAVWCARQVQDLMTDQRSIAALDVAERHANGQATDADLAAAWAAAGDAAGAAAGAAARAAGWAAAWDAAWADQCKAFTQLCDTGSLP